MPPVALADNATTPSGTSTTICVLANDSNSGGSTATTATVTAPVFTQPANGTVTTGLNGCLVFTPTPGFSGTTVFSYTICDPTTGLCSSATVGVNVLSAPPVAVPDSQTIAFGQSTTICVFANDTDKTNAQATLSNVSAPIVVQPLNGTVTAGVNGCLVYTPAPGFTGIDSFSYTICDLADPTKCASTTVSITVRSAPPAANPDSKTAALGTPLGTPLTISVLINDLDKLGNPASLTNVTLPTVGTPTSGTVTVNPDGTITYTPDPGFSGLASFGYTICDVDDPTLCATTTVNINVQSAPPTAVADVKVTAFNTPTSVTVLANDLDKLGNPASLTNVTAPTILTAFANGTASINATTGVLSYTPNAGFTGTDVATYQICDLTDPTKCTSTTVTIIVDSKAPVALPDSQTTTFGQSTTICVLANDQDKLDSQATLANVTSPVLTQPTTGTVTAGANGCVIYTPAPGFAGTASFMYTICDLADPTKCATAMVTVTVQNQPGPLSLLPKVYLQGALIGVYSPNLLMRDDLRMQGLLPTSSPYASWSPITATPNTTTAVFATTGANAIVDWVFVELRSPVSTSTVVDSRAALLQRDGDIVEVDGVSSLTFSANTAASYYVAVRHRNHLGVMTQTAIPLSATTVTVDFRLPSTPTFTYTGTSSYSQVTIDQAQVIVDQGVAMWAGNTFNDNEPVAPHDYVIYQGTNNDVNVIYQQVINPPGFLVTPFTIRRGYMYSDVNMDGKTIFQGTQNEVEFIYQNVIKNHPGNQLGVPFFKIREQLP